MWTKQSTRECERSWTHAGEAKTIEVAEPPSLNPMPKVLLRQLLRAAGGAVVREAAVDAVEVDALLTKVYLA